MARVFRQMNKEFCNRAIRKRRKHIPKTYSEIHNQRPEGAFWSRHHRVCPQVVRTAAASSPSGWSGLALCSRSRPRRSSWAGQNVPCRSSTSPCAGWPAIPTCWCQRVPYRCTWTADAPADCGCCICLSSWARWGFFKLWIGGRENSEFKNGARTETIRLRDKKRIRDKV